MNRDHNTYSRMKCIKDQLQMTESKDGTDRIANSIVLYGNIQTGPGIHRWERALRSCAQTKVHEQYSDKDFTVAKDTLCLKSRHTIQTCTAVYFTNLQSHSLSSCLAGFSGSRTTHFLSDPSQPTATSNNLLRACHYASIWLARTSGLSHYVPKMLSKNSIACLFKIH